MTGPSVFAKLRGCERPRLKADRRADVLGENVFLTTEFRHYVVQGRSSVRVLPFLDGARTVDEIAAELAEEMSLTDTLTALGRFAELGHLVDGDSGTDPAEAAWWDGVGIGYRSAAEALGRSTVTLRSAGDASRRAAEALALIMSTRGGPTVLGPARAAGGPGAPGRDSVSGHVAADAGSRRDVPEGSANGVDRRSLTVVLADDYLHPDLGEVNERALASSEPWLLARLVGAHLWIGPLFTPGVSACWQCLAQRIGANRQVERFVSTAKRGARSVASPPAMVPSSTSTAVGLVAGEVLRILAEGTSERMDGGLVTVDLLTLDTARHVVVRQPQCPACGDPSLAVPVGPVVLSPQPSVYTADGGHRVCTPSETVERLERHVSPITGAITKLHRLTAPGDEVSHAYAAGHNFALFTRSVYYLRRNLRGLAGGKGRSDIQAKASAMSEAIERYSGVWRGDEPVLHKSYSDLGDSAVHPADLLCFSENQYAERHEWNAKQVAGNHVVPEPFDTERSIQWSQVWSLSRNRPLYVPTSYCYYGHPDGAEDPFCYADSNGNAAGNTLEEAVLQGLLELIERDSVAIWWYNRLRVRQLELASFGDPYMEMLRDYYSSMGRSLWMLDITSDLGIPVYVVISHRLDHPVEDIIVASGAHLEPRLAALRALTECNQYLPMLAERDENGDTVYLIDDREANNWWSSASISSEEYLVPDPDRAPVRLAEVENLSSSDITKEVMTCVERIGRSGMEVLVHDQTRPDLDLNVVKVMAPGMRHFWRRLGPGRLFGVPVDLGWRPSATPEETLNPKSVFY